MHFHVIQRFISFVGLFSVLKHVFLINCFFFSVLIFFLIFLVIHFFSQSKIVVLLNVLVVSFTFFGHNFFFFQLLPLLVFYCYFVLTLHDFQKNLLDPLFILAPFCFFLDFLLVCNMKILTTPSTENNFVRLSILRSILEALVERTLNIVEKTLKCGNYNVE